MEEKQDLNIVNDLVIISITVKNRNVNYKHYSLNDNIVRGAAKSLAPLPTAWMDNVTRTTEALAKSSFQYQ